MGYDLKKGFEKLVELIKGTEHEQEVLELQKKYLDLDFDQRTYGHAPQTSHDIYIVVGKAINIGLTLGVSFNDLCL